jgi:hypothetical protein
MTLMSRSEDEAAARLARETGVQTPMNWRLYGLIALMAVAAILLVGQMMGGNKGTAVYPGSPVAAPQTENPTAPPAV